MAYNKKNSYPSIKTPGVYPEGTNTELGLNSSNLVDFSLGNWNSIVKGNKILLSSVNVPSNKKGVPINIEFDLSEIIYYKIHRPTSGAQSTLVKNTNGESASTNDRDILFEAGLLNPSNQGYTYKDVAGPLVQILSESGGSLFNVIDNNDDGAVQRAKDFLNYFYNELTFPEITNGIEVDLTGKTPFSNRTILFSDGTAFIQPREDNEDAGIILSLDDDLKEKIKDIGKGTHSPNQYPNAFILREVPEADKDDYFTHEIMFPKNMKIKNVGDDEDAAIILTGFTSFNNIIKLDEDRFSQITFFPEDRLIYSPQNIPPTELSYLASLGYPNFKFDNSIDNDEYIESLNINPVDFIVNLRTIDTQDNLLYYQRSDNKYRDTSYPIEVDLTIGLFNLNEFENNFDENADLTALYGGAYLSDPDAIVAYLEDNIEPYTHKAFSYYKYRVIQWGDEKQLLSDSQIENSYLFNFYDKEDYPNLSDYDFKKFINEQSTLTKPIQNSSNHVYVNPGVKSIKIVLYRYTPNGAFILQSYLITKNIVVNDGSLSSQDFSIFGTSNFNLLPLKDNQAIIGGIDENSEYNNSVFKIVKDDNFIRSDYLERVSSRDYVKKFKNGSLGKQPGQLDLGQTRVFTEPKDIYDFIGADKLKWINDGSGSLPINSLATDIFIRDDKCVVDLDPSNSEYSAIQNQAGSEEIGILIGDYKVNQPQGGRIQKESTMETPLLETDNKKQAF